MCVRASKASDACLRFFGVCLSQTASCENRVSAETGGGWEKEGWCETTPTRSLPATPTHHAPKTEGGGAIHSSHTRNGGPKEATSRARGYCTNSQMMPLKKKQSVLKRRRLKLTRMVSAGRT